MKAHALLWVQDPYQPTVIAYVAEPSAEGKIPLGRRVTATSVDESAPGIGTLLQKWLDRGWRLAPGFYAPTASNDCTTVFLEIEETASRGEHE